MSSNNNHNRVHIEDNPEFFGGEMQPYIDSFTKNYEQTLHQTHASMMNKRQIRKVDKISFWRRFASFFSFL